MRLSIANDPEESRRSTDHRGKDDVVLARIIVAILLPPLIVFLQVGTRRAFRLNILLTVLGIVPGILHAVWVTARR